MKEIHQINNSRLDLSKINEIITTDKNLVLPELTIEKIVKCRKYLDDKLSKSKKPMYGINTGFGSLYNVKISTENLTILQENLVMSHACGTGENVPNEIVKLMLFLKIQSLSYGHSGIQLVTVNRLIDFYNNDILPKFHLFWIRYCTNSKNHIFLQ